MDTPEAQDILAEALQREAGLLSDLAGSADASDGLSFIMDEHRHRTMGRCRTRTTGRRRTTCRVNSRRIRLLSQETKQRHPICMPRKRDP